MWFDWQFGPETIFSQQQACRQNIPFPFHTLIVIVAKRPSDDTGNGFNMRLSAGICFGAHNALPLLMN
jgi:hypothetical protein